MAGLLQKYGQERAAAAKAAAANLDWASLSEDEKQVWYAKVKQEKMDQATTRPPKNK